MRKLLFIIGLAITSAVAHGIPGDPTGYVLDFCTIGDVSVNGLVLTDTAPMRQLLVGDRIQVSGGIGVARMTSSNEGGTVYVTIRPNSLIEMLAPNQSKPFELILGSATVYELRWLNHRTPPVRAQPRRKTVVIGGEGTSYLVTAMPDDSTRVAVLTGQARVTAGALDTVVGTGQSVAFSVTGVASGARPINKAEGDAIRQHLPPPGLVEIANAP